VTPAIAPSSRLATSGRSGCRDILERVPVGAILARVAAKKRVKKARAVGASADTNSGSSKESPFGGPTRKRALEAYFANAGPVTAENAWEHVYRLLLSIDRRTQLAHVYDSNHMQVGGMWHDRVQRFTDLLCQHWHIPVRDLPEHVDFMFQACVREYLSRKSAAAKAAAAKAIELLVEQAGGTEEAEDEISGFLMEVTDLLVEGLKLERTADLARVVKEIGEKAEHYYTIEKKRQNVRGEGFEDTLERFLLRVSKVPRAQLVVRSKATDLPGFRKAMTTAGTRDDKVPKPDLAILTKSGELTHTIITVKWSLRQDRLDQFAQEARYYRDNKTQSAKCDLVFVTNEMDLARLRAVLHKSGGFDFERVYHVNARLLEQMHGAKFDLHAYKQEGRLVSLEDLIKHAEIAAEG
jgi:hypothetical protein